MNHPQRGATLFEICIALTVAGLLLGTVLVTINVLRGASVRNFIGTLEKTNFQTSSFNLKFGGFPGDIPPSVARLNNFAERAGTAGHGDSNGIINSCDVTSFQLGCETVLFWRDLYQAYRGSLSFPDAGDMLVDGTMINFNINNYLPPLPIAGTAQLYIAGYAGRNYYYAARFNEVGGQGELIPEPAMSPSLAYRVEEKSDDKNPAAGSIRAMEDFTALAKPGDANTPSCVAMDDDVPVYHTKTRANSVSCMLAIQTGF